MKKLFHHIARVIFIDLLLLLFLNSSAQKKIHGIVTDTSGLPLAGATIEKLSNVAASSSGDGSFSIAAQSGDVLIVSSIGRVKRFVQVGDSNFIRVVLDYDIKNLENVMVTTGYGTARQKDVTGAITKLSANEFSIGNITNPLQQVQGKMAGLVITNPSGDPNGEFTARIRGATSLEGQPPLVVIDGIAINDFYKAISTLNPNDVESYTILKDASSAAIYGTRGANGVILITTKASKLGKASIEYNGWVSMEKISRQLNVLNADQWRKVDTAMGLSGLDKGGKVDWQKAISQAAFSHNHMISFSGNSGQFDYRGSLGYTKQEGVILNTGKEMWTSRLMANQRSLKNKLETSIDINTSVINRNLLFDQWSTNQSRLGGSYAFTLTLEYLPVWPIYKPDGSYFTIANNNYFNPLFAVKEIIRKQRENFFQTAAKVNYELTKGLKAGVLGALSRSDNLHDYYYPGIEERHDMPDAEKLSENAQSFTGDAHINYRQSFHRHTVDVTGVYEYNKFNHDGPGGYYDKTEEKLISFLGRIVYNFNDRYILTANFRRDGSSKFGPAHRWGNFPSLALAWRINDESMLKSLSWLNILKLRISYGYTGNQANLPPNSYQLLYGPAGPFLNGGQILQSYAVVQEYNPDLKWEVRRSFNIGADFALLNNRLSGTVDVFHDKTSDMLFRYDLPQPPFLTNQVYANAADAINDGVEITLNATLIKNKEWQWDAHANLSTLQNKITNLSGQFQGTPISVTDRHYGYADGRGLSGAYVSQLKEGYPAGVFWVPQNAGLDSTGHELYYNYDSQGKLLGKSTVYTDQDRVYIDPTPDFTWGFTNTVSYKNFDVNIFLRGVQGQKIFANSLMNLGTAVFLPAINVGVDALTNGFAEQPQPSTYWVRNGSFARLDNLTIGYNFRKIKGINSFRIYATATNLFTITNYQGVDPEVRTEGSQRYIDKFYYPKTRGFTFGVNLGW